MIRLQHEPIDYAALIEQVRTPACGAVSLFLGTVREVTEGRVTAAMDYEAYSSMAEKKMAEIEREVRQRWPVGDITLVHRVGHLDLGEVSVAVAVSCPHRAQAFEACRYAIDRVKEIVPIWKKENWADGMGEWVHPSGFHKEEKMQNLIFPLSEKQREALRRVARQKGKTPKEVIGEVLKKLLAQDDSLDWRAGLEQAQGLWRNRRDLPDFRKLRAELDRFSA